MVKETANEMISEHNLLSITMAILKDEKKQSLVIMQRIGEACILLMGMHGNEATVETLGSVLKTLKLT